MTFRLPHLIAALALHVLLFGLLLGGVQCSAKPHRPHVITGVLLDPSRQEVARRQREQQRAQTEAERKRREDEARRKAEAQKRATAEAEAKKRREAEALRQKQLAEKQAAEKKAAEKKKVEDAARRKREQEQAERDAAARREAERARVERAMAEEAARLEAERAAQAQAEGERLEKIGEWAHALVRHVQSNYRKPPGAPEDFTCQLHMQLLPDGMVSDVRILKSCGNALLDRAVEDAVYRSSPMPRPADPSVFERELTINFTP